MPPRPPGSWVVRTGSVAWSLTARAAGQVSGSRPPTSTRSIRLIPGDGVYAAHAIIDGLATVHPAACHIGPNVTFGETKRTVEAHLLDFDGDLYGRTLELDILERLRPSRSFAGLDDLLSQIRRRRRIAKSADAVRVLQVLGSRRPHRIDAGAPVRS